MAIGQTKENIHMKLNQNSKKHQVQLDIQYQLMSEQLNNEESIGNSTRSRKQVDEEGNLRNKISGANTKHNIVAKLYQMTDDKSQLCSSCRVLSPLKNGELNLNDEDVEHLSNSGKRTKGCVICDAAGFMNAETGKAEKRQSVISVSDAIAEVTGTRDREMHSRLDTVEDAGKAKSEDGSGSKNMIFYEENRNSTYHQSIVIDLDRVGFDDHEQVYVLDKEKIKDRIKSVLNATIYHFINIEGAKMSVHKPHLISLSGTLRESTDSQEVLSNYSTMNDDYLDVQEQLNKDIKVFHNPAELKRFTDELLEDNHLSDIIERNMKVVEGWKN